MTFCINNYLSFLEEGNYLYYYYQEYMTTVLSCTLYCLVLGTVVIVLFQEAVSLFCKYSAFFLAAKIAVFLEYLL